MQTITLGRTGLTVTVMGLGGGGASGLGKSLGFDEDHCIGIVRRAIEKGVNFIDTAEAYGTEHFIGKAIADVSRESLVLSTKKTTGSKDGRVTAEDVEKSLDASLQRLGTDYIDVYHLHGVLPEDYENLTAELVPALQKQQQKGKVRFLGITEFFMRDTDHRMLQRALQDDVWDVMMVSFNIINPSARKTIFPLTREKNVGTLIMFAVRKALSQPEYLKEVVGKLVEEGLIDGGTLDPADPLGFLVREGAASSIPDAAYRFCRHELGTDVILSGTSSLEHLEANVASLNRGPLPGQDLARLADLFEKVDTVTGG